MKKFKYPRTYHLPFSQGVSSDDKVLKSYDNFINKEIVVTEKLDGENTTFYKDYMHARSIDSKMHFSRNWSKSVFAIISNDIPDDWRICLENLWAVHSIKYPDYYLESYLYILSIWNEKNICISYDETLEYAKLFDLPTPHVLYRGIFDLDILENISKKIDTEKMEGFVVRTVEPFHYNNFDYNVAKFVRKNHVQTDEHWLKNAIQNGKLINDFKPYLLHN